MVFVVDFAPVQIEHGAARITPEGYFVADALVGRANNIQEYRAYELGDAFADRNPTDIIRVFRSEASVFDVDSLASASRLPITLDHPVSNGKPVMVDAKNFREFTRGETGESILRDGEFIRVPIRVTDAGAVKSVQTDRQQFSLGYVAELRLQAGIHDGVAYDAEMTNIRYNHLAACRTARGGTELRITDERAPAENGVKPMKIVMVDGLPVDVSNGDTAATLVANLVAARDTATEALTASQTELADAKATVAERDAEIVTLKDAADKAKPTPAQLRDAAGEYARTAASAKALGATVTDDMDVPAMQKAACVAKLGDAKVATYDAAQIAVSFDTLAAAVADSTAAAPGNDPLRATLTDGKPVNIGDANTAFADARAKRMERFNTAHKGISASA